MLCRYVKISFCKVGPGEKTKSKENLNSEHTYAGLSEKSAMPPKNTHKAPLASKSVKVSSVKKKQKASTSSKKRKHASTSSKKKKQPSTSSKKKKVAHSTGRENKDDESLSAATSSSSPEMDSVSAYRLQLDIAKAYETVYNRVRRVHLEYDPTSRALDMLFGMSSIHYGVRDWRHPKLSVKDMFRTRTEVAKLLMSPFFSGITLFASHDISELDELVSVAVELMQYPFLDLDALSKMSATEGRRVREDIAYEQFNTLGGANQKKIRNPPMLFEHWDALVEDAKRRYVVSSSYPYPQCEI